MIAPVKHPLLPVRLYVDAVVHEDHDDARNPEAHRRGDDRVGAVHLERTHVVVRLSEPKQQHTLSLAHSITLR